MCDRRDSYNLFIRGVLKEYHDLQYKPTYFN